MAGAISKVSLDPIKRVQRQALQLNQHMHLRSHQFVIKDIVNGHNL